MKRLSLIAALLLPALALSAQGLSLEEVRADVRKAAAWFRGHEYNEPAETPKAPAGFKPFNISTYARHGARLYSKESLCLCAAKPCTTECAAAPTTSPSSDRSSTGR